MSSEIIVEQKMYREFNFIGNSTVGIVVKMFWLRDLFQQEEE